MNYTKRSDTIMHQGGWGHSLDHPLTLGGVILLKLFDPSYGFGSTDGKIALFGYNQPWKSPKPLLGSKSFRSMTPPKNEVSKAK